MLGITLLACAAPTVRGAAAAARHARRAERRRSWQAILLGALAWLPARRWSRIAGRLLVTSLVALRLRRAAPSASPRPSGATEAGASRGVPFAAAAITIVGGAPTTVCDGAGLQYLTRRPAHFSLHRPAPTVVAFALVLLHAAVVCGAAVAIVRAAATATRASRHPARRCQEARIASAMVAPPAIARCGRSIPVRSTQSPSLGGRRRRLTLGQCYRRARGWAYSWSPWVAPAMAMSH